LLGGRLTKPLLPNVPRLWPDSCPPPKASLPKSTESKSFTNCTTWVAYANQPNSPLTLFNVPVRVKLGGDFAVTVMHPLDVLASRISNAAGLLVEKGDHAITQAVWGVDVIRHAFLRHGYDAQADAPGKVGAMIQRGVAACPKFRRMHSATPAWHRGYGCGA